MAWDWTAVGQLAVGLALGIGVGGWAAAHFFEVAALRVAAHPSVRKIANAADRFSENGVGGWAGVAGKVVDGFMGFLGGGRRARPGRMLVANEEGVIIGEADAPR